MGVLSCNREGCENIMCDRYSPEYGYICWECFDKLIALNRVVDLGEFMQTERDRTQEINTYDHYNDIFVDRREEC